MVKLFVLVAICLLSAFAAQAQPRNRGAAQLDPNEMVCRNLRETGSRLTTNRVCMTRAQWEQQRRDARQNVDRAQTSRVYPGQ